MFILLKNRITMGEYYWRGFWGDFVCLVWDFLLLVCWHFFVCFVEGGGFVSLWFVLDLFWFFFILKRILLLFYSWIVTNVHNPDLGMNKINGKTPVVLMGSGFGALKQLASLPLTPMRNRTFIMCHWNCGWYNVCSLHHFTACKL